jgi:hypothetical protein
MNQSIEKLLRAYSEKVGNSEVEKFSDCAVYVACLSEAKPQVKRFCIPSAYLVGQDTKIHLKTTRPVLYL